jgi:hypothetical protein
MSKKKGYRVRNWGDYNRALIKRGSLTVWFEEESIQNWHSIDAGGRGRPRVYSDISILCMLALKAVFKMPLRATQGMVESLIELLKLPIKAANYTTLCRRQKDLDVPLPRQPKENGEPLHAVFDSTGLKVYGEGEWKVRQHGYSKRRTWRKLHLGIDESNGDIIAMALTSNDVHDGEVLPDLLAQIEGDIAQVSADGAYDDFKNHALLEKRGAKITIPPRENAKIKQHGNSNLPAMARDENIRAIRKMGRKQWKKESGYHRRSLAETAMFRIKTIFGRGLNARSFDNQAIEAFIRCMALNKMTALGMPDSFLG